MSEVESHFIHHGIWTDVSRGSIMGRIITTDTRTGTILVALMAVLCSMAMSHLWHLLTFGIHLYRADGKPSDALFRQQQAILRTFPTPSAVMAEFTKLYFSWRPCKSHSPGTRLTPLAVFAALFAGASTVAGVFSSYIIDTSNILVITKSPFCGSINLSDPNAVAGTVNNYTALVGTLASSLAQDCYGSSASVSPRCRVYFKPRIPFNVTRESCPWDPSMCLDIDDPTISMDSGLLNMNDAFGLNLPPDDQVFFRRKTSCAILPTENRTTLVPASEYDSRTQDPLPEEQLLIYSYGNFSRNKNVKWNNATFVLSLVTSNTTSDHFALQKNHAYRDPFMAKYAGMINLIPEIAREDADMILKLVVNGRVGYGAPVNDPIFSAHRERTVLHNSGLEGRWTIYLADAPGSVIACAQQYQFCLKKDKCTELNYLPRNATQLELPTASSLQLAVLQLLLDSSALFDIESGNSLQADKLIGAAGYISSLPNGQWVTEIIAWESQAYAALQIAIEKYATGPRSIDPHADSYTRQPQTDGEKALCMKQRVRKSGGLININVFALSFVCGVSILFISLDLVILRFLIYLSRFRRIRGLGPRIERWTLDGVLQLQRRAFEYSGQGTWKRLDKDVPVTTSRVMLDDLQDIVPSDATDGSDSEEVDSHDTTTLTQVVTLTEERPKKASTVSQA